MSLSLVILAAGMGSRFGGDKPMAAVGPAGQSLFEYSVYDAIRAGFRHIVFVVNESRDTNAIRERLAYCTRQVTIEFVVQTLHAGVESVAPELDGLQRCKPWGTAHAVLVCKPYINNPFVVVNADDYYGPSNFSTIGRYLLQQDAHALTCALPGYRLKNTLSQSGGVNRGVCIVGQDSYLEAVHEIKQIRLEDNRIVFADHANGEFQGAVHTDSIVSMTFWGFSPGIFDTFSADFRRFLAQSADLANDEFYIPEAINRAIQSREVAAKVFNSTEIWKGLTYATDLPEVRQYLQAQSEAGVYPASGPC